MTNLILAEWDIFAGATVVYLNVLEANLCKLLK